MQAALNAASMMENRPSALASSSHVCVCVRARTRVEVEVCVEVWKCKLATKCPCALFRVVFMSTHANERKIV